MELKEKKVVRLLRSLFEGGEVISFRGPDSIRKYRLTTNEEKSKNQAPVTQVAKEFATIDPSLVTDIDKYKLPSVKLENVDIKRLHDMQKDPRCSDEPWKSQIEYFLKNKKKCELEAFSRYGLDYVVKKYLPEKLGELDS